MARTPFLRESRTVSVRLGRQDQQHLRDLVRTAAVHDVDIHKSRAVRDALAMASSQVRQQEYGELNRLRVELEEERQRRAAAEHDRDKAKARADRLTKKVRKKDTQLQALLRYLPDVRWRVAHGLNYESEYGALNSLWRSCGSSWRRVQARLEAVEAELNGEDPPDPGGGAS